LKRGQHPIRMELRHHNLIRVPPMPACQISPPSTISAASRLDAFIDRVRSSGPVEDFQAFEHALHDAVADLEREVLQAELDHASPSPTA